MKRDLDRMIAAERAAPPQPPVGAAPAGWQRLQHDGGLHAPDLRQPAPVGNRDRHQPDEFVVEGPDR